MKKTLYTALLTSALVGLSGAAMAAGTAPGVLINNSIDLSYISGGNTITIEGAASVEFTVDRKVDFVFQSQVAGRVLSVEQGAEDEFLVFYLENEGNDVSGYDLDIVQTGSLVLARDTTGNEPAGTYTVYVGTTAVLHDAADVIYDDSIDRNLGDLVADDFRYVKIVANVPDSAADGAQSAFAITATALDAGNDATSPVVTTELTGQGKDAVDTIFADADADGQEMDNSTFVVQAPQLTGTKTVAVISENLAGGFNCATGTSQGSDLAAVPGACVEYTIEVTNATGAGAPANNLTVSDALPANVTYVASDKGDFDIITYDSGTNTITATLAALAESATAGLTIRATID